MHWSKDEEPGRAVYISPFQELVNQRHADWKSRLSKIDGHKEISKLAGETSTDLKLLESGDLILATPTQWDLLSTQCQPRGSV